MIFLLILILIILVIVFCYYQNNKLDISEYSIKSEMVSKPIRLVQLSDFHSKPFRKVLEKTKELKPDIIAVTGDFLNDKGKNEEIMLDFAKEIVEIAPTVYIPGNHEQRLSNFDDLMEKIKNSGFIVLVNEKASIEINNSTLSILGLVEKQADFDDYKERKKGTFKYEDMSPLLRDFEKDNAFKILLCHFPENFELLKERNYKAFDFDIQLSGHAHGGQFVLPIIGPLFSPGQGIFPKYTTGEHGDRPKLIISRGLGNSEFPLRLFNHPEINVIDIKNKE